jgi:hypothetical protein
MPLQYVDFPAPGGPMTSCAKGILLPLYLFHEVEGDDVWNSLSSTPQKIEVLSKMITYQSRDDRQEAINKSGGIEWQKSVPQNGSFDWRKLIAADSFNSTTRRYDTNIHMRHVI